MRRKSKGTTIERPSTVKSSAFPRIRFRDRKFNKQGYAVERDGAPTIKEGQEKQEITAHAMTVLRVFKTDGKYDHSEITINDEGLNSLLLHALGHEPWLRHMTTVSFYSLFKPIVHNWSMLNDLASNDLSKSSVIDLYKELEHGSNSPVAASGDQLAKLRAASNLEKATADLRLLLDEVHRTPRLESYFNSAREMQAKTNTVSFKYL